MGEEVSNMYAEICGDVNVEDQKQSKDESQTDELNLLLYFLQMFVKYTVLTQRGGEKE